MADDAPPRLPLAKDERELFVFRTVYDPDAYQSVVHQDRPDFVITLPRGQQPFGVEVTELHRTEADARLIHHPDYFTELLAGTRQMHADDPATLGVSTFTVSDKDGNVKHENVRGLLRQEPSQAEHSDTLAKLVQGKDAKAVQYESGLSHVNLVVLDTFAAGAEPQEEYCTGDLFGASLRSALTASCFDEVFLVTLGQDRAFWHRPLRLLLLFEAFYLFMGALESYEGELPDLERVDVAGWFASLTDVPGVVLGADPWRGADRAYWGRYAIRSGESVEILDNHDLRSGSSVAEIPLPAIPDDVRGALVAHANEFARTQRFHCQMWLPAPVRSAA